METKKLSDGTYLIATGSNIHNDHIHITSSGTILSHKVNGTSSYKYSETRKGLSDLYEEITGERNKFPGGWRP